MQLGPGVIPAFIGLVPLRALAGPLMAKDAGRRSKIISVTCGPQSALQVLDRDHGFHH
jgi:hypothetical protein